MEKAAHLCVSNDATSLGVHVTTSETCPLVSIIIVCYNAERHVERYMRSLARQEFRDFEIILVDNQSADKSVDVLRQYPEINLILNPVNNGSTGGNNQALAAARGKWIFISNLDTILEPNFLAELVRAGELDERIGAVAPKILRMNRASKNGQRIAEQLAGHPKVARVLYPTLFADPDQSLIFRAQCAFPGAIFSLELKGGKPAAFEFLRYLRLARNAVSLGGVETLACHPRTTTHSGYTEEESVHAGVTDGLVRVSVGIEDWRDLLADFKQSLDVL